MLRVIQCKLAFGVIRPLIVLIYQAPSDRFIDYVRENTISDIMSENYKARPGKLPGTPEFVSWQNSLSRVRELAGTELIGQYIR